MNRQVCPIVFGARLQRRFHIELQQMDSADPPLAVHGLYVGRYRQHHRHSTEEVHERDGPPGGDPARLSVFHWSVLARAAVCSQMAQQAIDPLNGRLAAVPNLNPSGEKSLYRSLAGSERNRLIRTITRICPTTSGPPFLPTKHGECRRLRNFSNRRLVLESKNIMGARSGQPLAITA